MEETLRISVRELVAFTYFQEDILPAADVRDLLTGTRAHRARQEKQEGKAECSLKHVFEVAGEGVLVFGRMDAFTDGDEPFVEEIKLSAPCRNTGRRRFATRRWWRRRRRARECASLFAM